MEQERPATKTATAVEAQLPLQQVGTAQTKKRGTRAAPKTIGSLERLKERFDANGGVPHTQIHLYQN